MENATHLSDFGKAWWGEVCKKVKKSVVYIDDPLCECLRWHGGVSLLFDAGALNVKEFSLFECQPPISVKKAVFLCSGSYHGGNLKILENLIRGSGLEYCVLVTTSHQTVHHLLRYGGRDGNEMEAFTSIEEQVLHWMGNMNFTVEVFYFPVCTVYLAKNVLLMPAFYGLTPLLNRDVARVNEQLLIYSKTDVTAVRSTNELTFPHLPLELQGQIRHLVVNLNSVFQHLNAKEDIFSIGDFSRIVGSELENLPGAKNRRKGATRKVSIVFVDRSLDLAAAAEASSANLYDRILCVLPKFSPCSSDVAIPMSEDPSHVTVSAGCLAPPFRAKVNLVDVLMNKNAVEAVDVVNESLAACLEDVPEDIPKRFAARVYREVFERCAKDEELLEKHGHLIQVATAIHRSLTKPDSDLLGKWQSKLAIYLNDSNAPSPLIEVAQLLKSRAAASVTLDDVVTLLVYLYALEGDPNSSAFSSEIEAQLRAALAEAFVDEKELSPTMQNFVGEPVDEVKAGRAAKKLVELLHCVAATRVHLKRYRQIRPEEALLSRIVSDIFDPAAPEIPDLEYKSGGLKDLLKTGFSLFVNVRKPKVADNSTVIIFVIGGLRPGEIKVLKDLARDRAPNHEVIFGSSHLINRHDVLDFVLNKHL